MCYFYRTQMRQRWQGWCRNFPKSYTGAHGLFEHREYNICSGACGLPELGSNCYIALTEQGGKCSQESLSSLKCVVPYCKPTSEHVEETDVWTFAVKLGQTLSQRDKKKNPQFSRNYLSAHTINWKVFFSILRGENLNQCLQTLLKPEPYMLSGSR